MSHPLVRKELRSLAPFAGLILFFNLLNWADVMLTKFPDQYPLHELFSESGPDNAMMFMVAFALAAGLLVREADVDLIHVDLSRGSAAKADLRSRFPSYQM